MTNQDHISEIERQLAEARKAASPVIVEKVKDTKDEVVYVNKTSGTIRQDLRGGTAPQFHPDKPALPQPEVHLFDKPVPKEVGRVLKVNEEEREIKLAGSGTIRTDRR